MKKIITLLVMVCLSNITIAQIPTNSLSAYWSFNGNANDSSGNGNNGTVHGATLTKDRFGNCNQAYKFNGINNYILVPNSSTVDMNNTDFTVAFWIKTYAGDTNGLPVCKGLYGSFNGYQFGTNSSNPSYCSSYKRAYFYVAAGAYQAVCSDSAICKDTTWHFFTGVYKHTTNQAYFYIDTILQSTTGQASASTSNNQSLFFGADNIGTIDFFTGVLDAIRLYQRALSAAEIAQLYNEPNPGNNCSREGVEQVISLKNAINIYPNPSKGSFVIESSSVTKQTMQVYDVNGKVVLTQVIQGKTTIDASSLNEGVYNLSIISSDGMVNKRIVIGR